MVMAKWDRAVFPEELSSVGLHVLLEKQRPRSETPVSAPLWGQSSLLPSFIREEGLRSAASRVLRFRLRVRERISGLESSWYCCGLSATEAATAPTQGPGSNPRTSRTAEAPQAKPTAAAGCFAAEGASVHGAVPKVEWLVLVDRGVG